LIRPGREGDSGDTVTGASVRDYDWIVIGLTAPAPEPQTTVVPGG
jgi:hypothetical protein